MPRFHGTAPLLMIKWLLRLLCGFIADTMLSVDKRRARNT